MQRLKALKALALCAGFAVAFGSTGALADTTLRVFSGGANQRPDLMRKLFDQYQAANPGEEAFCVASGSSQMATCRFPRRGRRRPPRFAL